jgi:hypothetical protein
MNFLTQNGFEIGKADSRFFIRNIDKDLFICQIYVDDIIFDGGSDCRDALGRYVLGVGLLLALHGRICKHFKYLPP